MGATIRRLVHGLRGRAAGRLADRARPRAARRRPGARRVTAVERARMREDFAEIVPECEHLIRDFTGLSVEGFRSRAWVMSRGEWIGANLKGLQRLIEPLAERLEATRPGGRAEVPAQGARACRSAGCSATSSRKVLGPVRRVPAARRRGAALLRRAERRRDRAALRAPAPRLPAVDLPARGHPSRPVRRRAVAARLPARAGRHVLRHRAVRRQAAAAPAAAGGGGGAVRRGLARRRRVLPAAHARSSARSSTGCSR